MEAPCSSGALGSVWPQSSRRERFPWTLFLAVQFADLLFWIVATIGVEHFRIQPGATAVTPMDFYDYPISHSLAGLAASGLLLGGAYFLLRRSANSTPQTNAGSPGSQT